MAKTKKPAVTREVVASANRGIYGYWYDDGTTSVFVRFVTPVDPQNVDAAYEALVQTKYEEQAMEEATKALEQEKAAAARHEAEAAQEVKRQEALAPAEQ